MKIEYRFDLLWSSEEEPTKQRRSAENPGKFFKPLERFVHPPERIFDFSCHVFCCQSNHLLLLFIAFWGPETRHFDSSSFFLLCFFSIFEILRNLCLSLTSRVSLDIGSFIYSAWGARWYSFCGVSQRFQTELLLKISSAWLLNFSTAW